MYVSSLGHRVRRDKPRRGHAGKQVYLRVTMTRRLSVVIRALALGRREVVERPRSRRAHRSTRAPTARRRAAASHPSRARATPANPRHRLSRTHPHVSQSYTTDAHHANNTPHMDLFMFAHNIFLNDHRS